MTTSSQYSVIATIKSQHNGYQKTLEFLAVPSITTLTPNQKIDRRLLNIPKNVHLADPTFNRPSLVHLLIGSGPSFSTLCVGQIKLSSAEEPDLVLQKTQFGWIIGGSLPLYAKGQPVKCHLLKIESDISRFWEIEDGPTEKRLSPEEAACEDHFVKHVARDSSGRYTVALPFNEKCPQLGESYTMAMKRLHSLKRRLAKSPDLNKQYSVVLTDYLDLGYMSKVTDTTTKGYYLPHQAVIKESSMTTKVRVVFDASASSSTGVSLNDALMCGPTVQDDIFSLLIRFRLHNYVLTGDIEKMYLQISVRKPDQRYLRILWYGENESVTTYQFNRLIFGLKPASFLATRCLQQHADDGSATYPTAAKILKRDLYVDDLLTGTDTIQDMILLRTEITQLLSYGGFNLRQCASNSDEVMQTIPDTNVNLQLQDSDHAAIKTLGVHWNSDRDAIIYTVQPTKAVKATKRQVCSEIARIFDPLGLLNPVVVTAKVIMQELWKLQLDWDESLPQDINTRWTRFVEQLPSLNGLSFDRKVLLQHPQEIQLHGFCDASERAYGACIYLRSRDSSGETHVHLYCAKSRVAPIKNVQTIPRLELCAASLLAASVRNAISKQVDQTFFWTDSTITLNWIKTAPHLLKVFVSNRVANIQMKTGGSDWRYVPTQDNPADLLSRGLMPVGFTNPLLWRKGPSWLVCAQEHWPKQPNVERSESLELRKPKCFNLSCIDTQILHRFSSFITLQRVIAFCLRLLPNLRCKAALSVEEVKNARIRILKIIQRQEFPEELNKLGKGQPVSNKSKLLSLNPFLDGEGIIRVGGRLQKSQLPYDRKHPILLPKANHVTKLIINYYHEVTYHGGIQATLYALRQHYWLIDGRNQVRHVIRSCVKCTRFDPPSVDYIMGNLPEARTLAVRPFTNTGVDYCGPFFIKEKKNRNRIKVKIYVAIFICLSTKAVHLEVVSDLTTEGFIAALKRFIARRGLCSSIYSDNATNFVGANNELKQTISLVLSEEHNRKVQQYLSNRGITWRFSPPQSPHYGGIWERAVRSFKHHLRRVSTNILFTFEQFNTLVIEIEAIVNSRPLTPLSSDPQDLLPLTPAHFLIGDSFTSLPEQNISQVSVSRLSTWQHLQKLKQDFWARWHKEYINELNVRRKWCKGTHSIRQGSMVLVREDHLPPLQWRLGRVVAVQPGQDGVIRSAKIRTVAGEVKRCIKKLVPLPIAACDNGVEGTPNDNSNV